MSLHKNSLEIDKIRTFIESLGYKLISETYEKAITPIQVLCSQNHSYTVKYSALHQGQRCPVCISIKDGEKRLQKLIDVAVERGIKVLTKKYEGVHSNVHLSCSLGHDFFPKYKDFLGKNTKCPYCIGKKFEEKKIENIIANCGYTLLESYTSSKDNLLMKCPKGHIFKMMYNTFQQGHRCPSCSRRKSRPQAEITEFIKSLITSTVYSNTRGTLGNLEMDIYIPDHKLVIEFDGLYWHSTKPDRKTKSNKKAKRKNHRRTNMEKINLCNEKGLKFFGIYEDEWKNRRPLMESMIKYRLGVSSCIKLRAKDLELRKLTNQTEFQKFFEEYHLSRQTKAKFAYGLFLGEKLISCMSFRWNKRHNCWEIARFATDFNYIVYGAPIKLLKEIPRPVVSYSDNRISSGNVYKKLGFEEITETFEPSYFYTDFKSRIFRTKCMRINKPEVLAEYPSERTQALAGLFSEKHFGHKRPLYKIYDYGQRKWLLK